MNIRIAPLPASFLHRVREEGVDDQGQPVWHMQAEGGEPCRDVLRRAEPGEELILASFSPFAKEGPYREYGPVFLLANPSDEDVTRATFPANGYFRERLVLRAYDEREAIRDAALVTESEAAETLARLLADEDTAFVHARFPVYGCFGCRIDKV
jgi:hypothetical protein